MNTFSSVDEVLNYAITQEEEAAAFYTQMAAQMENREMSEVFEGYAEEEMRHKETLENLKRTGGGNIAVREVLDLKIAEYMVDVEPSKDMGYQDALLYVVKREQAAAKLYADLADKVSDEKIRRTLEALAQEEAKHKLHFESEYDDLIKDN